MNEHHEKTHIKTNSNTETTGFTSFSYIERSTIEDLIKCDICNIIFDLSTHAPLMLKCGHTFCKRCIALKSNNPEKNINKQCPLDKKKNIMSLELAIPNLKLETIIKKLNNLNISTTKRHMVYSKPVKKSISPIKSTNSNNALNNFNNNVHNNINVNNTIKFTDINSNNINNNVNIVTKGKDSNTLNVNIVKPKPNILNKKMQNSNKSNNIKLVKEIKNKIQSLSNINNVNSNVNDLNNNNNIINLNKDINKDINKQNLSPKNISSEIADNLNIPQLEEEMNVKDDKFLFEEENFKKGMINETIDTIPMNEEKSVGDTSFGGDINELLLKSMQPKNSSINEDTFTEEFNNSLKKLNLMGNQENLNITSINLENNNDLKIITINKGNLLNNQNNYQIRTIYDKIKMNLKNSNQNGIQKENNNNNIINNISNSIIIINDDNINIITDNSSSLSQEKLAQNNKNDELKINKLNNKNNFFNDENSIKINPLINKNFNINLTKEIKPNDNNNTQNNKIGTNIKISKIGINKHTHSNSDDFNEEKNKEYLKYYENGGKKLMTINAKRNNNPKEIKNKDYKESQNDNLNISLDSGSNSNSYRKKNLSPANNLSKSFANLSGNNMDDFDDDVMDENKNIQVQNMKKNLNKFMTINAIKSSETPIEKIKNNIYYESQAKNNQQINPSKSTKKKLSNNNIITDIKNNVKEKEKEKEKENNNNIIININNINNNIEQEKNISDNIINNNQNISKNINNNFGNNNTNINIQKNNENIGEQILKKNSKTNEVYKRLKNEFDSLSNEIANLIINKAKTNNNNSNNIHQTTNKAISNLIHYINNIKKKQEQAFQNYFKNQKYKLDQDKAKVKFFKNNSFFIGILEPDEKTPKRGILVSFNGDYYEGEFLNGKREGEGKLIYANGNQYEGFFSAGWPNGKGKLVQMDNDIYEGEWKNGKINGQGIRYYNNGDIYTGNHLNDLRSGFGIYQFANGNLYKGNWANGMANGKGVLKCSNGDVYDGEFIDNAIYGKGSLQKKNGELYIGEFKDGYINGYGKHVNILGEQYVGGFVSGKKNGMGKLYNKEGKLIQTGNWKNDKFIGNIKYSK